MHKHTIPFNKPYIPEKASKYILDALMSGRHCGNHKWGAKCIEWLKNRFGFREVFLVPSGTAALEMGVMLAGVEPGDEVILPSYTFSSTATSVIINGAKPIFCEVEEGTMNLDPLQLEKLITNKTKLIVPIDYAGVPCNIEEIKKIAARHNIPIMIDAAQSMNSKDSNGNWVGTETELAAFSFHETKNFGCGEGGALVVNKPEWIQRAHFIQEKGTDRRLVLDGVQSKYGWVDKGSSYLLSDILAAMLFSQFECMDEITELRKKITDAYRNSLQKFENLGFIKLPVIPEGCIDNGHAFYLIFDKSERRQEFLYDLKNSYGVSAYIGYSPLHSSKMGLTLGWSTSSLPLTENLASRIVRLPFYADLARDKDQLNYVTDSIVSVINKIYL